MKLTFSPLPRHPKWKLTGNQDWHDWRWQFRAGLKSAEDFAAVFALDESEKEALANKEGIFQVQSTPYYASLAAQNPALRKIVVPKKEEFVSKYQEMLDPLGEKNNNPVERIIHRYPDRVLFLVTDLCSVYCRYCTRKHFTGQEQVFPKNSEYEAALDYIRSHPGIREVILSGGDPLTLSDQKIEKILKDIREIEHIEIIRIGSRMPVVCPMRITKPLVEILQKYHPVYMMTHFNHPDEVTREAADALTLLVNHGVPCFNQMVLLNGVNNHPAIVQALSRRLLFLRVKPYYMFQCDPSEGTDHLRNSIEDSLEIQKELWGNLSGLAMPTFSIDIPNGGGKTYMVPNFQTEHEGEKRKFKGWDGVEADYISPPQAEIQKPEVSKGYAQEWEALKNAKNFKLAPSEQTSLQKFSADFHQIESKF